MTKDPILERSDKLLEAFEFAGTMAEQEQKHQEEMRTLLLSCLEVMDSFDRFFAHGEAVNEPIPEQVSNWLNTFRLIRRQLEIALQKAGAVPISCLGERVAPDIHEIIEVKETDEVDEEVIIEEVIRGYEWNGNLLRRPQVVVAKHLKEE